MLTMWNRNKKAIYPTSSLTVSGFSAGKTPREPKNHN